MKTFLFALGTLGLVGCSGFHMVGPFAKSPPPLTEQGKTLPSTPTAPAPPPLRPTPTMYVTPADVDPDNPSVAASKLSN